MLVWQAPNHSIQSEPVAFIASGFGRAEASQTYSHCFTEALRKFYALSQLLSP
jgi:hypothetical protein